MHLGTQYSYDRRITVHNRPSRVRDAPPNGYFLELSTVATGPVDGYNFFPVTITCPNEEPYQSDYPLSDWLNVSYAGASALQMAKGQMKGSDSYSVPPYLSESWRWDLRKVRSIQASVKITRLSASKDGAIESMAGRFRFSCSYPQHHTKSTPIGSFNVTR